MGMEIPEFPEDPKFFTLAGQLLDWAEAMIFAAASAVFLFALLFRLAGVKGHSMVPTLYEDDRLILSGMFYEPKAGDIVVADLPHMEPLIKRIIAVGGQTVDIDFEQGIVYVDGQALEEPYINEPTYRSEGVEFPVTVPEGCCFLMGDNRNHSTDSRSPEVGMVAEEYILGKALFRFFPLGSIGSLENEK